MANPKLKLGNNIWATRQKSLLAYNDEGGNFKSLPFQVDRISGGTYVGRNGLIQTAASNEPRVDFTNNTKGALLLEPQRTNYAAYSAQFDNSYWSKATSDSTPNPTVTANVAISPDGGLNADRVQLTSPPDAQWAVVKRDGINTSATVGSKLQQSLYLKAYDSSQVGKNVDVYMYDFSNTVYKTVYKHTLTSDWQRVVVEHTISGTNTSTNIQYAFGKARNYEGGSTQAETATDFLVWGAQLEKADTASSYIPTSSADVTRVVDFTFIPSGLQNILNTSEGTLFVDVDVPRVSSTGSFERIVLSDQNASTDRIIFDNYGGNWRALMLSSAGNVNKTIVSVTANQRIKVAIAYSSTELRISYDGNAATTTTGTYAPTTTLESLKFSNKDGGSKWNGNIYNVKYFDSALSNAELVELTS